MRTSRVLGAMLLAALCCIGCSDPPLLVVELRTDLSAPIEFRSVRVTVTDASNSALLSQTTVDAAGRGSYVGGVIVAQSTLPASSVFALTELLDEQGQVIISRMTAAEFESDHTITVLITRSCLGVVCPSPGGDASLTSCLGGVCVSPSCNGAGCGVSECNLDTDCASDVECVQPWCADGACFYTAESAACDGGSCDPLVGCVTDGQSDPPRGCDTCEPRVPCAAAECIGDQCFQTPDDTQCEPGEVCDVTSGCRPRGECECDDGNPCTDDGCDTSGECVFVPNESSCEDGVFCNGVEVCGDGSCQPAATQPCEGSMCDEAAGTCADCMLDTDCGGDSATDWSECVFSDTCINTGIQTREVTTRTCEAGACAATMRIEERTCDRETDGTTCGDAMYGEWGSCAGFDGVCGETGTQERAVMAPTCQSGACMMLDSMESRACERDTDGVMCASRETSAWSTCAGFAGTCGEDGTQSRIRTDHACSMGTCVGTDTMMDRACMRDTDGTTCGTTQRGAWGACTGGTLCANNGTQSRTVTRRVCVSSGCGNEATQEDRMCTRSRSEVCDAADDDCDGRFDEGVGGGCRVGVHRAYNGGSHLYTTNLAQAQAHGLEAANYFWVYGSAKADMRPLYRCIKSNGKTFLTTASDCEVASTAGRVRLGWVRIASGVGSRPLYRLYHPTHQNHFYALTTRERDNAISLGFTYEGLAAYVFNAP